MSQIQQRKSPIYALCLFIALGANAVFSQVKIADIIANKPYVIATHPTDTGQLVLFLPMPFASSQFKPEALKTKLPAATEVHAVHLVYTRYKQVDTFNQPKLNQRRLNNLKTLWPDLFKQSDVQWRVFEQKSPKTLEAAEACYHGFVIYLKNRPPKAQTEKEIAKIDRIVESYKDTQIWIPEKVSYRIRKREVETGYYLPHSNDKKKQNIKYTSAGLWFRKKETRIVRDSIPLKRIPGHFEHTGFFDTFGLRKTDEYKILTRKNWEGKYAVLVDVTGSMTPYTAQVMLWMKHSKTCLENGRMVFFNDGNETPDMLKRIGYAGGLHFAESHAFDTVYKTMKTAMRRGDGGDIPENNIEALIAAQKRWPNLDSFIMIADNNAAIKDISLIKQVTVPVNIILCGDLQKIHPNYVELAAKTNGRIYTIDAEVSNLNKLKLGGRIDIGKSVYEYRKEGLIKVFDY
jgi:hypothetical protein